MATNTNTSGGTTVGAIVVAGLIGLVVLSMVKGTPSAATVTTTTAVTVPGTPELPAYAIKASPAGKNKGVQPAVSQKAADAFNSDPWVAKLAAMGVQFADGDDKSTVLGGNAPASCPITYRDVTKPAAEKNGTHLTINVAVENKTCTPGVIHTARMANALEKATNCSNTGNFRPAANLTNRVKRTMIDSEGLSQKDWGKIELDHLVPESLCAASDVRNLWAQPPTEETQKSTTNAKDYVETQLASRSNKGVISVSEAVYWMLTDWSTALSHA
jgi:hypothetical protein